MIPKNYDEFKTRLKTHFEELDIDCDKDTLKMKLVESSEFKEKFMDDVDDITWSTIDEICIDHKTIGVILDPFTGEKIAWIGFLDRDIEEGEILVKYRYENGVLYFDEINLPLRKNLLRSIWKWITRLLKSKNQPNIDF